jgi:Concanavalin A-like lectin/glucanases superfamily
VTSAAAQLTVVPEPCPGAPSGMVASWRGEGNTGDYAGTNDAMFEGVVGYGPGEVGQAFLFDGATSYLQVPNNPLWAFGNNDFTIEFWANLSQIDSSVAGGDGSAVFVGHDEGAGRNKWLFGFGGGQLYFYVYSTNQGPHFFAPAAVNLAANQWYHLGLTKADAVFQLYVNGSLVSAETNSLAVPGANAPLTLGQAQGLFLNGLLDEVSLYNRGLEAGEILSIYQAGSLGKCAAPPPPISLEALANSKGTLTLRMQGGQMGATLSVEATQDFKQWTNIGQVVKSQDTEIFNDPAPALARERYYRVRQTGSP